MSGAAITTTCATTACRKSACSFRPIASTTIRLPRGPRPSAEARREKPERAAGPRSVLFAGKLVERKRPIDVIRALALLATQGCRAEAVFAGSGELEDSLRREAASSGVAALFHGFQNQSRMPSIYAAADLLVLPSDHQETWGLVVNEAMACGVPAVVSDAVGCGPDLIDPGRTGAVFPLGDVAALAQAIRATLALETTSVRRHLSEKMAEYSPVAAARGIIAGAVALRARRGTAHDH